MVDHRLLPRWGSCEEGPVGPRGPALGAHSLSLALHDRRALVANGPPCLRQKNGSRWPLCLRKSSSLLPRARACPAGRSSPAVPSLSAVPSASMTRLARSRTASLTSASSVDGGRPQACTHSESSEGLGQVNHTMEVSC